MTAFPRRWLGLAAVFIALATPAAAQEPFYKGKVVSLIIGNNASGGFDTYGRLVARYLPRYLAGAPSMVVQNMPGAGGVRAANTLYTTSPKDGTTLGMIDQAAYLNQLLGVAGLQADIPKFNWIGRMMSNSAVLIAWHTSPVKKAQDLVSPGMIVGATGSASRLNWSAMNALVGTKFRMITGYEGAAASRIAMERGEIEGLSVPWSLLRAEQPEWLEKKFVTPILQTGIEKDPGVPDVPRMIDLAPNEDARKTLEIFSAPSLIGRSMLAPPGVPAERVAELRAAFWKAINDTDLRADAAKLQLDLDPLPGDKLQGMFAASYSDTLLARAREIAERVSR